MKGEAAILDVPIDVATALEILRSDSATVVLHASENGVEIRLPFTIALDLPLGKLEEADPPPTDSKPANGAGFVCKECRDSFVSPQALGAHRRYNHPAAERVRVKPAKVTPIDAREPAPKFVDAGLMEHRKFDPDAVRAAAAGSI